MRTLFALAVLALGASAPAPTPLPQPGPCTDASAVCTECGHNDRCVYTTDAVFPIIFPR